jgi:hypothetical protein
MTDESVDIAGDFNIVDNFKLPVLGPLTFGPKPLQGFMRVSN